MFSKALTTSLHGFVRTNYPLSARISSLY